MGFDTIVDVVFLDRHKTFDECVALLHDYPVLFVHVTCPLEELRRREKERGDRFIGQAEEQLPQLCPQDTYDITMDTSVNSVDECGDRIIEQLNCPEKNTAFKTLWSRPHCGGPKGPVIARPHSQ